jgi:hypothetical protein
MDRKYWIEDHVSVLVQEHRETTKQSQKHASEPETCIVKRWRRTFLLRRSGPLDQRKDRTQNPSRDPVPDERT